MYCSKRLLRSPQLKLDRLAAARIDACFSQSQAQAMAQSVGQGAIAFWVLHKARYA
ncbi:MAG: hypothetical protein KME57_34250 [Scytonema hyalinum WJT4-NPBG1]|nr:hypothetical protein [Scytonema hyalinum WJT4-NPBG1]